MGTYEQIAESAAHVEFACAHSSELHLRTGLMHGGSNVDGGKLFFNLSSLQFFFLSNPRINPIKCIIRKKQISRFTRVITINSLSPTTTTILINRIYKTACTRFHLTLILYHPRSHFADLIRADVANKRIVDYGAIGIESPSPPNRNPNPYLQQPTTSAPNNNNNNQSESSSSSSSSGANPARPAQCSHEKSLLFASELLFLRERM
ncbi:MAG: hypothetical protein LQ343_005616 [Gyalolechia ehrenbergii]|nr:MAG: hypothetical protein LQ343_005616 [Gyalolechia ehrenbergii]